MDHRDEWFSPESVEEQIECHLYAPDQLSANARLLHDLQHLAQDDDRRLARIRKRLVEHVSGNMQRQPVPLQHYHDTHAWPAYQPDSRHAKGQSLFLVKLMSGIAAMLVIGSMLGAVILLRSRSEQGNSNHKPPSSTSIVHGMAAFLMDATSGKVLVDVNSHAQMPIASIAKVMTAVVAIDNAHLDQPVTIEQAILDEAPPRMSTAQLQAGDQIQLRDLLYGLLLPSGNDAALVIAHAVAGNTQNFVMMMNNEAHQLQLNDTHFSNPYGLYTPDDYSSAADLTRLARYAMQLTTFAQVVAEQEYVLPASSHNHRYVWHTTNTLLAAYPGMNGIETGYDVLAGACMVFSAQRANRLLIGTVLHTQSERALNSAVKKLLDQGFAS